MKRVIVVSIGLVLLIGCAKRGTGGSVSGTVTYNGKPVNRATLFFRPTSYEGKDIDITTSADGTFNASNIPPGEYKIFIEGSRLPADATKSPQIPKGMDPAKADEMKKKFEQMRGPAAATIPFPQKYRKAETSDLSCTITEGKQENVSLVLKD